jgi:hypothetical protein
MTLIATIINKYGIVLASDSNLTSRQGNSGFGQKIFPISYLRAGLAYSGLYYLSGKDIDEWMIKYIENAQYTSHTIEEFAKTLTQQLTNEFKSEEPAIIHICGYSKRETGSHVEHWHIANTNLDEVSGNYSYKGHFDCSNDFNSETQSRQREMLEMFDTNSHFHQFYINGFPPARISLMAIKKSIENLLPQIAAQETWSFRAPKNIFETANYLKMYLGLVEQLFKMSDYEALFVGGETQTYLIPAPYDLVKK